jgi:hypothetical protein
MHTNAIIPIITHLQPFDRDIFHANSHALEAPTHSYSLSRTSLAIAHLQPDSFAPLTSSIIISSRIIVGRELGENEKL